MNAPVRTPQPGDNTKPLITEDQLKVDFAHVEQAMKELEDEAAKVPPVLEDDDDLATVTAVCPKLVRYAKRIDTIRDEVKAPYRDAGDTVQRFFKALEGRMKTLQATLEARGKLYLDKKRAAADALRREEEARLRREADAQAQAAAAKAAMNDGNLETATAAHTAAKAAERQAEAAAAPVKPADLARTHTPTGMGTLQEEWKFEITDFNALDLNDLRGRFTRSAIDQAIGAAVRTGVRELKGVRIYSDTKFRSRG